MTILLDGEQEAATERQHSAIPRLRTKRHNSSVDTDIIGFIARVPPEKLAVVLSAVSATPEGRAAVLEAASGIATHAGRPPADTAAPKTADLDTGWLTSAAGDMLTSAEVADRMGQTRQSINEMLKGRRILGVRFGSRWRFPSVQFRHHEPLPGLSPVLKAIGEMDPWRMLEVLLAPSDPPGQRPIELLRQGDKAMALAIASRKAAAFRAAAGTGRSPGLNAEMEADLEADVRRDEALDGIRAYDSD